MAPACWRCEEVSRGRAFVAVDGAVEVVAIGLEREDSGFEFVPDAAFGQMSITDETGGDKTLAPDSSPFLARSGRCGYYCRPVGEWSGRRTDEVWSMRWVCLLLLSTPE